MNSIIVLENAFILSSMHKKHCHFKICFEQNLWNIFFFYDLVEHSLCCTLIVYFCRAGCVFFQIL